MFDRFHEHVLTQSAVGLDEIACPECGHKNSDPWERTELVTTWAEGEWIDINCHECGIDFMAQEHVKRNYDVRRKTDME